MDIFRNIELEEIDTDLFSSFIRRQVVDKCLRYENGQWVVKSDPFIDDWTGEDYRDLINSLRSSLIDGGFVYGFFHNNCLKGFVSVSAKIFGGNNRYIDMENIHISLDFRRKGIGRKLFEHAAAWARGKGASKLYISAHSAIETQEFYIAMGCKNAVLPCQKHVEAEPFDVQMEYSL